MSSRATSLLIVSFGFIALIAFVYAFVQQAEAKRQATLAIECERKSVELIKQLEAKNREAAMQVDRAQAVLQQVEEMRVRVESESKKK